MSKKLLWYEIFKKQYRNKECRDKLSLPFDFVIFQPNGEIKCLIEYQGEDHYMVVNRSRNKQNSEIKYNSRKKHDEIKRNYCQKKNIKLIEIPYWNKSKIADILEGIL